MRLIQNEQRRLKKSCKTTENVKIKSDFGWREKGPNTIPVQYVKSALI
jgi:hypothetical protein